MRIHLFLLPVLFVTVSSYSQPENRVITTAVPFLQVTPDARAAGMGDLGGATSADAYSQQWNPAKYAFALRKSGLGLSYTPYLSDIVNDIFLGNISYYNRINERSAWAASFKYFSLGEIEFRETPEDIGLIERPNELTIDVSYSLRLSDRFSMGVAGRYLRSDLRLNAVDPDATAASSFAVDIAGYYQSEEIAYSDFNGRWRAGFNIANMGPKMQYDELGEEFYLPTNLKLAGGFDFIFDAYNTLGINLELNKLLVPTPSEPVFSEPDEDGNTEIIGYVQPDVSFIEGMFRSFGDAPDGFSEELQEITIGIGTEYTYQDAFALRLGYFHENENKGARQFFTLGAGFAFNIIDIDISYLFSTSSVRSPLENTLRFSLAFNFGDEYIEY